MNARLQRLGLLIRTLLGLSGVALGWKLGGWSTALCLGLFLGNLRSVSMLSLFLALAVINRQHRPGAFSLLQAWWCEAWALERSFGWRQPFASQFHADFLPAATGARGVLLLHGFSCNRGLWNDWMPELRRFGLPHIALTLEPIHGSIDSYAEAIEQAVVQLETATGQPPLLLAHSMGGLASRAWWRKYGRDGRVHGLVTLGSPHAGTVMAFGAPMLNARQMRHGSSWLQALSQDLNQLPSAHCFFSDCDQIVCPAETATLPGARNVFLPGRGHLQLVDDPQVRREVLALLREN
ncbi:esterase/lipase family protein [Roseateles microcysteis]|uniref:esterase/lipase family protein n=1 Tax=Roseateles microcysteis TaxID=3119057 RepID=UPI002FE5B653